MDADGVAREASCAADYAGEEHAGVVAEADAPALDLQSYSISDLASAFDITPRAIRFYETKGLLAPLRRGQTRIYGRRDWARLSLIVRGKRVGFSLDEIKELLDLYDLCDGGETQMRRAVEKYDERIAALEAQRVDLEEALTQLHKSRALMVEKLQALAAGRAPALTGFAMPAAAGDSEDG